MRFLRDAFGRLSVDFLATAERAGAYDKQALAALVVSGASDVFSAADHADAVTLVRHLKADIAVDDFLEPNATAVEAGRRLAEEIAKFVRAGNADEMFTFSSVAEYLAHFVAQLLAGKSVDAWYFRPLRRYIGGGLARTLARLAHEEPEAWPEVLKLLKKNEGHGKLRGPVGERAGLLRGNIAPKTSFQDDDSLVRQVDTWLSPPDVNSDEDANGQSGVQQSEGGSCGRPTSPGKNQQRGAINQSRPSAQSAATATDASSTHMEQIRLARRSADDEPGATTSGARVHLQGGLQSDEFPLEQRASRHSVPPVPKSTRTERRSEGEVLTDSTVSDVRELTEAAIDLSGSAEAERATTMPVSSLTGDEGWPLFLSAWEVVRAALGEKMVSLGGREMFARFLATDPAAPMSWSDERQLGECIAEMVAWLLNESGVEPDAWKVQQGRRTATSFGWFDAGPTLGVLQRESEGEGTAVTRPPTEDASPSAETDVRAEAVESMARSGRELVGTDPLSINRTKALRVLAAARLRYTEPTRKLAAHVSKEGETGTTVPSEDLHDEIRLLEDGVRRLAAKNSTTDPAGSSAKRVTALVSDSAGEILQSVMANLSEEERWELSEHIAAGIAEDARRELRTDAVGLFLLIRPLMDLRLKSLAEKSGIRTPEVKTILRSLALGASGAGSDDVGIEFFVTGSGGNSARTRNRKTRRSTVVQSAKLVALEHKLRTQGARLGVSLPPRRRTTSQPLLVGEFADILLDVTCRQFVRWLRGFQDSSNVFVLEQFVRRPGAISNSHEKHLVTHWPGSPYDVVLEMAGYLENIDDVPWWEDRGLRWER